MSETVRRDTAQGREWCPGAGQPATFESERWWSCPSCGWVGFRSNKPLTVPAHQTPIIRELQLDFGN